MSIQSTGLGDTERPVAGRIERAAYSIDEFCAAHGFSRSMFYLLQGQGLAPKTMNVGTRRLITAEAAAEWRRAREAT
jgi:predicted DNA-binding transcriptional regulator AlpA